MPYPPAWSQAEKLRKICTAAGPNVNNMKSSSVALAATQGEQYCCTALETYTMAEATTINFNDLIANTQMVISDPIVNNDETASFIITYMGVQYPTKLPYTKIYTDFTSTSNSVTYTMMYINSSTTNINITIIYNNDQNPITFSLAPYGAVIN